jgi:pyrroloquinoline quinone biosynthesis protein B
MKLFLLIFCGFLLGCSVTDTQSVESPETPYLVVLGVAQDAGYPQAGCQKDCCRAVWEDADLEKMVSCLGLVDPRSGSCWLLDATPDFPQQWALLNETAGLSPDQPLAGIFLTHAHIGHYTGLMYLGREAVGADQVPVYAMPQLDTFLQTNGPWEQLVKLQNIQLRTLQENVPIKLAEDLSITPFSVPHRDEYSETAGFLIQGPEQRALFIPDIDKWDRWNCSIDSLVRTVDYAFLDATFFKNGELPNRDMSEIPHPFVEETVAVLSDLSPEEKKRVHFIHFNHTNPLLGHGPEAIDWVREQGFNLAEEGKVD